MNATYHLNNFLNSKNSSNTTPKNFLNKHNSNFLNIKNMEAIA